MDGRTDGDDVVNILSEQRRELMAAQTLDSDLEMAFKLQMLEAMTASLALVPSSSSHNSPPPSPPHECSNDAVLDIAAALMLEDVERFAQEREREITIAMSFKALSTLSPDLMAAKNSGIAFSGSFSTNYSNFETHQSNNELKKTINQNQKNSSSENQILKGPRRFIYLNILGSDIVSHVKQLRPDRAGPRNSKRLGRRGRSRLGGSETRRSIPHILQHL